VTEIGTRLREARIGRGLELVDLEASTKIRARYLAALEEERFDALPGTAYAKAFLRTYAQHLGLQAQPLVDDLDARLSPEEPSIAPLSLPVRRSFRVPSPLVLLPLAAGLLLVTLLVAGEFGGGSRSPRVIGPPSRAEGHAGAPAHRAPASGQPRPARLVPKVARVVLTAARGDCWLLVRIDSQTGRVLYENTLSRGRSTSFVGSRLWIRIGAPGSLSATLNGRPIGILPRNDHPTNVLVGPGAARIV